jgi:peptidylprolyl isomerase
MRRLALFLILVSAGTTLAMQAGAQAATTPKTGAAATAPKAGASSAGATAIKLPPGIARARGVVKTAFSLRYQDIKLGTGPEGEPNKIYKVFYTGWIAADGRKFDSSDDHRLPLRDKDGKPVMGDDGKAKLGDPQPLTFAQGFGRLIPGFDSGCLGMKVGGKRRLFIPWQLAYGAHGHPGPDAQHPGIPPKADLIFDVELVDVADMPAPMNRPMPNPVHPGMNMPGRAPGNPGVAPNAANPGATPGVGAPAQPSTPGNATPPATKPQQPQS